MIRVCFGSVIRWQNLRYFFFVKNENEKQNLLTQSLVVREHFLALGVGYMESLRTVNSDWLIKQSVSFVIG